MSTSQIIEVEGDWQGQQLSVPRDSLVAGLERGRVVYFPRLGFPLEEGEAALLDPAIADPKRKNISLAPDGKLVGVQASVDIEVQVRALVARYQTRAASLIDGLLPEYRGRLRAAPTSLRLHRVETRKTSWRADDSRLHIDAFPSRPNRGERILRVFANINPNDEPRVWRVGEPFEEVASRFVPRIPAQKPGSAWLLKTLGITKSRRTPYDHRRTGGRRFDQVLAAGVHQAAADERQVRRRIIGDQLAHRVAEQYLDVGPQLTERRTTRRGVEAARHLSETGTVSTIGTVGMSRSDVRP